MTLGHVAVEGLEHVHGPRPGPGIPTDTQWTDTRRATRMTDTDTQNPTRTIVIITHTIGQ